VSTVTGHSYAFRRLANADCVDNSGRHGLEVNYSDGVSVALPATLVTDNCNITLRTNFKAVGSNTTDHERLAVLYFIAVDGQDRNLVIAVASHQRVLAIWREGNMARSRLGIAKIDLTGRRQLVAAHHEHGNGAFTAVGDQDQCAGVVDRYARGTKTCFEGCDNCWWLRLEIDHRKLVIRYGFFWIGGGVLSWSPLHPRAFCSRDLATLRACSPACT